MAGTEGTGDAGDAMPRIVRSADVLGGDPRIEGTRIGVAHVYRRHVEGDEPVEEIAAGLDVSVAAVHAALAYGFANPDEMAAIERRNREVRATADVLTPDEET